MHGVPGLVCVWFAQLQVWLGTGPSPATATAFSRAWRELCNVLQPVRAPTARPATGSGTALRGTRHASFSLLSPYPGHSNLDRRAVGALEGFRRPPTLPRTLEKPVCASPYSPAPPRPAQNTSLAARSHSAGSQSTLGWRHMPAATCTPGEQQTCHPPPRPQSLKGRISSQKNSLSRPGRARGRGAAVHVAGSGAPTPRRPRARPCPVARLLLEGLAHDHVQWHAYSSKASRTTMSSSVAASSPRLAASVSREARSDEPMATVASGVGSSGGAKGSLIEAQSPSL